MTTSTQSAPPRTTAHTPEAALEEVSRLLRTPVESVWRMGTTDRRFVIKIAGQVYVVRCRAISHPRALCRSTDRVAGRPIEDPWLSRQQARRVLSLLHAAADAHAASAPATAGGVR